LKSGFLRPVFFAPVPFDNLFFVFFLPFSLRAGFLLVGVFFFQHRWIWRGSADEAITPTQEA